MPGVARTDPARSAPLPPDAGAAGRSPGRFAVLAFHVLLLALTVTPIALSEMAPLTDLPNHMARVHVLAHLETEPALQANYATASEILPYLLVDFLLIPLVGAFGVYPVANAFSVATMVLIYAGLVSLSMALQGRLTIWPALALPLLYNRAFQWGFMNFSVGVGLMFFALAIWVRTVHWRMGARMALLLVLCAVLYAAHILVVGAFGVLVGAYGLARTLRAPGRRWRSVLTEFVVVVVPFLVTFAVFLVWFAGGDGMGDKATIYGSARVKLGTLLSPVFFTEQFGDVLLLAAYLAGAAVLAWRGLPRLAPHMALPLGALALVCLVMPNHLLGVWGVDFRFPPMLAMLAVAATTPRRRSEAAFPPGLTIAVCLLVALRVASVWEPLQQTDRQLRELRAAMSAIPEGARVLVGVDVSEGKLALPFTSYWHWGALAVIERNAFVPSMFTGATQLRASERNRAIDTACGPSLRTYEIEQGLDPTYIAKERDQVIDFCHRIYWADWPNRFDALILINPDPVSERIRAHLGPVTRGSFFEIAEIRK